MKNSQAWLSAPLLILVLLDASGLTGGLLSTGNGRPLDLVRDLVFFNNLHICLSFFLLYKLSVFQSAFEGMRWTYYGVALGAAVALIMYFDRDAWVITIVALLHAFFQSLGIFLLYFCPPQNRAVVKRMAWAMLFLVLGLHLRLIPWNAPLQLALGTSFVLALSYFARSWLAALFAVRFLFWFYPSYAAGFAMGVVHGLEYVLIFMTLWRANPVQLHARDLVFFIPVVGIVAHFTLNRYFGVSYLPLEFVFYTVAYSHYLFDTYAFRFRFPRPRKFILPLFQRI